MKWLKFISVFLLLIIFVFIGTILLLQENHYKKLLSWGAEQFLDSQLVIDGPLEFELARNLSLSSSNILLHANDDSYRLELGKLYMNFRLGSYMQTGSFWFNNIELHDINLKMNETPGESDFDMDELQIPPVILNQAAFSNINVSYQELAPGTLHNFKLDELELKELAENQPVSLRAVGIFESKPFKLNGTFDSVVQVLKKQEPANLDVSLSSELINFRVQGVIAEPIEGRGLDISVEANSPQIRELVEIVWDEIPVLGNLQTSFRILGDYDAPRLMDINLHLQRGQEVDLKITGSVTNLVDFEGLDLQFSGESTNPEVLSWLMFDQQDRMQTVQLSGVITGDIEDLLFQDINALAKTTTGLTLEANGVAELHPETYNLGKIDAGLNVTLTAPNTRVMNFMAIENIPDIGPLSTQMALAFSKDAVAIYNLKLDAGHLNEKRLQLKGDIGSIYFKQDQTLSELNLQAILESSSIATLGELFDTELPELGPAQLQATLKTHGSQIQLENAQLKVGTKERLRLEATGSLAANLHAPDIDNIVADLDVILRGADIAQLNSLAKLDLPDLGPLRLRGNLVVNKSIIAMERTNLIIGTDETTRLLATGRLVTHLSDLSNLSVAAHVEFESSEVSEFAQTFEYSIPQVGPMRMTAWLESEGKELRIEDIAIVAGTEKQRQLRATGSIITQLKRYATSIDVSYDIAVAPLVEIFTELQPRNLGRIQGNAVIADIDGNWGIENFIVKSTNTDLYQLGVSGSYDDLEAYDDGEMNSSLVIDDPSRLGIALGIEVPEMGAFSQKGQMVFDKARMDYKSNMILGKTQSVTKISGYEVNGRPTFEGSFQIPFLHLKDLGVGSEIMLDLDTEEGQELESPYIFSRNTFDLDFLNNFDFDLVLAIDEVESGQLTIDSIYSHLTLNDGHLTGPINFIFEGGKTDISLDIKALKDPEFSLSVVADDVKLGPLMSQVQEHVPINGYTNINMILESSGNSPHLLASNVDGEISFGLENARIPNYFLKILSVDVFGWVLGASSRDTHANLNCVVMDFDLTQGIVQSAVIIADGPRLSIGGSISLNLAEETMDITLIPSQKRRMFSSTSPVHISGPMRDPQIRAIPARQAAQQVGSFMVLGTGLIIPVAIVSSVWSRLGDNDQVGGGCDKIEQMGEEAIEKVQQENDQ